MRPVASSLPLALVALAACATGGTEPAAPDAAVPDASSEPDAPMSEPDAEPIACSLRPLPDVGTLPAHGLSKTYDGDSNEWRITFGLDPAGDYNASIILREGVGLFQTGVKPGKYDIFGADARYESCSLCVSVEAREGLVDDPDGHRFHAASGALHVTAIDRDAGTISGFLAGADFEAFELSEKNGTLCNENSDCGRTWCGLLACVIQEARPELCGFSIGRLNF